jgi:hypothetical protein
MDPERHITLKRLPRFVTWFGVVFALLGTWVVIAMVFGIGEVTASIEGGPSRPATPADAWLPGLFILFGLGVVLIRHSVVLDVEHRTVLQTAGWGPWVKRKEIPLSGVTLIDIGAAEERGVGSGRYTAVPVRAKGPARDTELAEPRTPAEARKLAQRIARVLGLPVGPGLTGSPEPQPADVVDLPAAQVARLAPVDLQRPSDTRVTATELMHGLEIRYPMVRDTRLRMATLLLPVVFLGIFCWAVWRPGLIDATSGLMWVAITIPLFTTGLVGVPTMIAWYRAGAFGGRITVDAHTGLYVEGRSVVPDRVRVLEIVSGSPAQRGLRIVLDSSDFIVARGQSPADLRWIRALILQRLQKERRPSDRR